MFRLLLLGVVFLIGLFVGLSLQQSLLDNRCVDAGGRVGAHGLCMGIRDNG